MRDNRNVCAVCDGVIPNPICALCLTDEIEGWLEQKKISLVREFRKEVRTFLDRVRRYNRMRCSRCRIETETAICPTCFTERVFVWLAKKDKVLATGFVKAFNYGLKQKELFA